MIEKINLYFKLWSFTKTSMHFIGPILIIYRIDMIDFKRRFHGNGTSSQFYTVPNLNPQDLSYHMVYLLLEGEGEHQLLK